MAMVAIGGLLKAPHETQPEFQLKTTQFKVGNSITFIFVQTQKLGSKTNWPKSAVVLEPSLEVGKVYFYLQWT